jgi:hypothetical protein
MVVADRSDDGLVTGTAKAFISVQAVNAAFVRADIAGCQPSPEPLRPLFKLSGVIEGNIIGL